MDLKKFTLIDFPGRVACIGFTLGCNFRCPYCHNPDLVLPECFGPTIPEDEVFSFLEKRKNKLEGVVITGGEPTIQGDLEAFIRRIKDFGFLVKLDTNGENPDVIRSLLDKRLIDYIAMDVKAPIEKYEELTRSKVHVEKLIESIKLIMSSQVDYEFRTTVVKEMLSNDDILRIGSLIRGAKRYCLQKFSPKRTLDPSYKGKSTYSEEEFRSLAIELKNYVEECIIR